MRIISRSAVVSYYEKCSDAKDSLEAWLVIVQKAEWRSPHDVKTTLGNASVIGDHRVVFNIKGNDYRLIAHIRYSMRTVYIKWRDARRIRQNQLGDNREMKMGKIQGKEDYRAALARVDEIIDAPEGTPEYEDLDLLAGLISDYEDIHYPIGPAKQEEIDQLLGKTAPLKGALPKTVAL